MDSVLVIQKSICPINKKLLDTMSSAGLTELVGKLKAALLLAERHDVAWSITLADDEKVTQVLPRSDNKKSLEESEALVMAVELHHIFHNNPNVYTWPVKLARGAHAYLIRRRGEGEALMTTIVLNSRGYYLTSYDPTKNEFFPPIHGLSTKAMQKVYPQMLDELQNMYTVVKKDVKELRAKDEEASSQKGEDC